MIRLITLLFATSVGLFAGTPVQRDLLRLELPRGWKKEPLRHHLTIIDDSNSPRTRSVMLSVGRKNAGCLISAVEIAPHVFNPKFFLRQPKFATVTVVREASFSEWAGRQGHGVERLVRHDYGGTVIFTASRRFAFHENGVGVHFSAQSSDPTHRVAERNLQRAAADLRAILRSLQVGLHLTPTSTVSPGPD